MARVFRVDRGGTAKATKQPNGYLRADGFVTRTGVFKYKTLDGKTRLEYRPPEEVFRQATLDSFELVPLTNNHPPVLLDANNTKQYQVGTVGKMTKADKFAASPLLVTDAETIKAMESGKTELSGGYYCDVEETSGVTPDGERYDCIQRNIEGNHVAIVDVGRAGPQCRARLDGADAVDESFEVQKPVLDGGNNPRGGSAMRKIRIDGITFEVSEAVAEAFEKAEAAHKAKQDALQAAADKEKGRADGAEAEAKKEKDRADKATDPKEIQKVVAARTELVTHAGKVLGSSVKLDDKSDDEVKKLVVLKIWPDAKLDGASSDYLAGRFESAVSLAAKATTDQLRVLVEQPHGDAGGPKDPVSVAREKEHNENANRWKVTLDSAKDN